MQNAKHSTRQLTIENPINPKKLWGPLLSILCRSPVEGPKPPRFPTHRLTRSNLTNTSPVNNAGWRNWVILSHYCACAKPILDLYFFAIFMVLCLPKCVRKLLQINSVYPRRTIKQMCWVSLTYNIHSAIRLRQWFENNKFFCFFPSKYCFLKFSAHFLEDIMGNIWLLKVIMSL